MKKLAASLIALSLAFAATGCDQKDGANLVKEQSDSNASTVVLMKTPEDASKFKKQVGNIAEQARSALRKTALNVDFDVLSLQHFSAGVILGTATVADEDLQRDPDKLYGDFYGKGAPGKRRIWNRFTIGAKLALPFDVSVPNIVGPLGINLGATPNLQRQYILTVPTTEIAEPPRKVLTETWDRLVETYDTIGAIRIPFKAEDLVAKYPPGSEIEEQGARQLLTTVGVNVGVPVLQANLNVHALLNSSFDTHLKILAPSSDGASLIRYVISSSTGKETGVDTSVALGITLFSAGPIDGVAKLNLFSAKVAVNKTNGLIYDFTYDVSKPEAAKALASALKGDLRPTQQLAVFRENAEAYGGIVINRQRTSVLTQRIKAHAAGLALDNSLLDSTLGQVNSGELLTGLLKDADTTTSSKTVTQEVSGLEESGKVVSFNYDDDKLDEVFWGVAEKRERVTHVASQVISVREAIDAADAAPIKTSKLSFSYTDRNWKSGTALIHNFFRIADGFMEGAYGPDKVESCLSHKAAKLEVHGTFYDDALARIVSYDEDGLWARAATAWGLGPESALRDPAHRAHILKLADRDIRKSARVFARELLPRWRKIKAEPHSHKRAEYFRDVFQAYGRTTGAFEVLTTLAGIQPGIPGVRAKMAVPEGLFLSIGLESQKCKLSWTQDGDAMHRPADVVLDWK